MESAGEDYREGFTDLTYGEFVREYANELIANYIREEHEEILQETEFFDFIGREYKENRLIDFNDNAYDINNDINNDINEEEIW